ncbi:nucleoside hydrolase [Xylanimonas ulmi]|uniref:Purine nucleosidase n=2 Tax=Xylanimonas ulmi TaxID=228973 RepID=A0A4Q7M314_9MICO|nr:purine nucleosidase [Xylanibacterium ulmi]
MDCDTGFDDALAMIVVSRATDYHLVGISTVVGNTSLENTTANTLAVVEAFGIEAPVYRGAAKPLAQDPQTIEDLLGGAAMGTVGRAFPPAARRTVEPLDAISALVRALEAGPLTILGTGPLTNIAMALNLRPDLADRVERLVFMGGSATTGNHTAAAEFNTFADPESLDAVLRSGIPIEMFGLNVTRQVPIRTAEEDALRASGQPHAALLADHVGFYLRMIDKVTPRPMALHDPTAAAYLAWPQLFELQDVRMAVELHGTHTRGETVCEFRVPRKGQPNARAAVCADGEEVMRRVLDVLLGARWAPDGQEEAT